jgi:hypothetical protein
VPSPPPDPVDAQIVDAQIVPDPAGRPAVPDPDYDEHGVPSLGYVREKIEGRYATSIGAAELAEATPEGREIEEQEADRAAKAKAKLDEIRRSLGR